MEEWKYEPARDLGVPLAKRPLDLRRETGLVDSTLRLGLWVLLHAHFALWHRLRVEGLRNLPAEPPFVIVANHESHLDALALADLLSWKERDRVFPIGAGDVFFEVPVVAGFFAFLLNALPLWRKNCGAHALKVLRDRMAEERCVYILFPEGTRTRTGEPGRFKAGLGRLVAGTPVPVVPCRIEGSFRALPPGARLPRPVRITIRVGAPLLFAGESDDRAGWTRVAGAAEAAVAGLGTVNP